AESPLLQLLEEGSRMGFDDDGLTLEVLHLGFGPDLAREQRDTEQSETRAESPLHCLTTAFTRPWSTRLSSLKSNMALSARTISWAESVTSGTGISRVRFAGR